LEDIDITCNLKTKQLPPTAHSKYHGTLTGFLP